ncbi:MAG: class I SAM-dependent methyltransferase [Verrucomicrobia bacterium]|nr:class I SAM-dependent methyltransferase [Verrucomicrobiota bacterium]
MAEPTNRTERFPETADIETSSEDYASRFAGPTGRWMLSVQEHITTGMLAAPPQATILDVGGGHGQLAAPLSAMGCKVTVLGSDESCRTRIEPLIGKGLCKFKVGNVVKLPFPDKAFDHVISFRLLPHCARWQDLVSELCRVARGTVIVDYPTTRSLNVLSPAMFGAKKKIEKNTRPFTLFKHADVSAEFARCNFTLLKRRGEFFVPMVAHRMLRFPLLSALVEGCTRLLGLNALFGSPVILQMRRMTDEEIARLKAKAEKKKRKR